MYEAARRGAAFAAATGGLLLVGVGCASADSLVQATVGGEAPSASVSLTGLDATIARTGGVLSGNTVGVPLNLPIDLCDVSILSNSTGAQSCSSTGTPTGSATADSSATGLLSGNTVGVPLNLPIDLCDVSILSNSTGAQSCSNTGTPTGSATADSSATDAAVSATSVLSGNVVQAPLNLPIDIGDLGVLGGDTGAGACSCSPAGSPAGGAAAAPAASSAIWSDALQTSSAAHASQAASNTTWTDTPQTPTAAHAAPAASGTTWSDALQTSSAAHAAQAASTSTWSDDASQASTAPTVTPADASLPYLADTAPVTQRSIAQVSGSTAAVPSNALDQSSSVPFQWPTAGSWGNTAGKQVLAPVAESAGRLAETGSNVTPPLCAAGAALAAGTGLSALATKVKAAAARI